MTGVNQFEKSFGRRGLSLSVALLTLVLLAGSFFWRTGSRSGQSENNDKTVIVPELTDYRLVDLNEQLTSLRRDLDKLRARPDLPAIALCTALLRVGDLERSVGTIEAAISAFREVLAVHSDANHWQVVDATRRLDDIRGLAERESTDQKLWQEAFKKQSQAEAFHAQGRYLEGIAAAENALSLRRSLWGDAHSEVAESLLRRAWLCTEHADYYLNSRDLATEAAEATRQAVGSLHPAYGDSLFVRAMLADDRGEFNEADRLYDDAQSIYKNSVGEFSRQHARVLSYQGRMHGTWLKEFAGAKVTRAQYIRQQVLDSQDPDCAETLEALAQTLYRDRQFPRAEDLLNKSIAIRLERQGRDHPDLAWPKSLLGACLAMRGDSSNAAVHTFDALALMEKARGGRHPITCEVRYRLALVKHFGVADYFGALRDFQMVERDFIALGLSEHPHFCRALSAQVESLGWLAMINLDTESLTTDLYWRREFATLARSQDAVDAYRAVFGTQITKYHRAIFDLLNRHWLTNYTRLDREAAAELVQQIEHDVMSHGGPLHPDYSGLVEAQDKVLRARGKLDEAILKSEEGLRLQALKWGTGDLIGYANTRNNLVSGLIQKGTDESAEIAVKISLEALDMALKHFEKDVAGQSDSARLLMLTDAFVFIANSLSCAKTQEQFATIYDRVLAVKGSASSFQMTDRSANDHPDLPVLMKLRDEAHAARQLLKAVAFTEKTERAEWSERLANASDARELAENRLALETRNIVPSETDVTWRELQQTLPSKTVFIDFLQFINASPRPDGHGRLPRVPHILAFIVKSSSPPICLDLGRSRPIRAAVSRWARTLRKDQELGTNNLADATAELAALIWTPLVEHLNDVDTLVIAPDGPLCFVSFAAMPGRTRGSFALEDYVIHYTNSGRWLRRQLQIQPPVTGHGLLTCGDIQYHALDARKTARRAHQQGAVELLPDADRVPNLLATKVEIEDVKDQFSKRFLGEQENVTLSGTDATAPRFAAAMRRNWRSIHFAGHGLFIPPAQASMLAGDDSGSEGSDSSGYLVQRNQLLLSGLVLAPASPEESKPGFLTAEDLGSFDLRQTDLVVLSACETGLGCAAGGDGVLGLTRAFLTAGVRSVISSLWKVDDAATTYLMTEFYRNHWNRGLSKSEALRQAQLSLLRNPDVVYDQRQQLVTQLHRSLPEMSEEQLKIELAQSERGLVAGEIVDIDDSTRLKESSEHNRNSPSARRTHPALWAAFILNGDAR